MDRTDHEMTQLIALRESLAEHNVELTLEQTDVFLQLAFEICEILEGCIVLERNHADWAIHIGVDEETGDAAVELWDYVD